MALEQRLGETDEEYSKRQQRVKRTRQGIDNNDAFRGAGGGGGIRIAPLGYTIDAPINVAGTGSDDGGGVFSATITWENPLGNDNATDSFTLYKDGVRLITVDGSTFTYVDKDVLPDVGYVYSVTLTDTVGYTSGKSLEVSVPIPNLTLASAPTVDGLLVDYNTGRINITTKSTQGTYPIDHYVITFAGRKTVLKVGTSVAFPMPTPQGNAQVVQVAAVDTKGFVGTPVDYSRSWWYSDFTLVESLTNTHFDSDLSGWSNGTSRTVTWDNGNASFPTGTENANLFQDINGKPQAKYFMLSRVQTNGLLKQHVDFAGEPSSRIEWNTNGGWQEKFALRYGTPEWAQTWTDNDSTTALMDYFVVGEVTNQVFAPDAVQNLQAITSVDKTAHALTWTNAYLYNYPLTSVVLEVSKDGGVFVDSGESTSMGSVTINITDIHSSYVYRVVTTNSEGNSTSAEVVAGSAVNIESNSTNGWHGFSSIKAGAANDIFGSMTSTLVEAGTLTQLYVGGGTQCRLAFVEGDVGAQVNVAMGGLTGLFDYVASSNDYELFDDPFSTMVRDNIGNTISVSIA